MKISMITAATMALIAVSATAPLAQAQNPTENGSPAARAITQRMDFSKSKIEGPLKSLLRSGASAAPKTDVNKLIVSPRSAPAASPVVAPHDRVSTGLITWHNNVQDALSRSAKSGKPVLVFHMMGMLDDRFC